MGIASKAFGIESAEQLQNSMASSDIKVRSAAIENFVRGLGTADGQNYDLKAIPILIGSLSDTDVNVRRFAVNGLLIIATETSPILLARTGSALEPNKPDLLKSESLQQALLSATSDPDTSVRQMALATYATTYKLTPDVESKIIQEFNGSSPDMLHQPFGKTGLLESLMISGSPSAAGMNFLGKILDDPKYGWFVINRIGIDECPLTPEVMAKFADMLSKEKDEGHKQDLVRAIGAYGAAAAPYLQRLEQMLANNPSEGLRLDLQNAIKQIREAMEKAAQTVPAATAIPQSSPIATPAPSATPIQTASTTNRPINSAIILISILLLVAVAWFLRSRK
jgi:hypothetical protein